MHHSQKVYGRSPADARLNARQAAGNVLPRVLGNVVHNMGVSESARAIITISDAEEIAPDLFRVELLMTVTRAG